MPTSQLLPNAAAVFGVLPCALGINALLRPRSALQIFQFPLPASPDAHKLVDALLQFYGARNVTIGISTLTAWYFGDRNVLGGIMLSGCVVVAVDGWVTKRLIGRGEWYVTSRMFSFLESLLTWSRMHWALLPVGLGLGGGLLGWFDGWL